jgi:hypothetical protein
MERVPFCVRIFVVRWYMLSGLMVGVAVFAGTVVLAFEDQGFARGADVSIELPRPSGPYAVGRKLFDWIDEHRPEPFEPRRPRELMVWIWYPAKPSSSTHAVEYVPGKWGHKSAKWKAFDMRIRSGSLLSSLFHSPISAMSVEHSHIHAVDNAPTASPEDTGFVRFPVLLFEPGLGNMPTDYTAILEDITSHGFIVVGIDPTYFAPVTVFLDGREVGQIPLWERGSQKLEQQFPIWVRDFRFVLDRLQSSPGTLGDLAQVGDFHRMGAMGHSYGGAAALAICAADPRIIAAADWDGTPRGSSSGWKPEKPIMLLQSDHGKPDRDRDSLRYFNISRTGFRVVIKHAAHRAFTDEVVFPLPGSMRKELVGRVSADEMVSYVGAYTRAFFEMFLCHQHSYLLCSVRSSQYIEVERRGTTSLCETAPLPQ